MENIHNIIIAIKVIKFNTIKNAYYYPTIVGSYTTNNNTNKFQYINGIVTICGYVFNNFAKKFLITLSHDL